jgi:hypothetical protein
VQTDRTIANNNSDIVIRDNEKGMCMLIYVVITGERNLINIEAEKVLKCKGLTVEIRRMWNVQAEVIIANNRDDWNHFKFTKARN